MAGGPTERQIRALAALLVLVVDVDPALASLSGQAHDRHLPVLHSARVSRTRQPVPPIRKADIGIRANAFHSGLRVEVPILPEEPETVAKNRAAIGEAGIVRLDDARRFADVDGFQRGVDVVALRPVASGAEERRP